MSRWRTSRCAQAELGPFLPDLWHWVAVSPCPPHLSWPDPASLGAPNLIKPNSSSQLITLFLGVNPVLSA